MMGVARRTATALTLPSPASGRGFSPFDPHIGEARNAERLEPLHVRARRLDLGERAERHGVDALQDDLLHPRERRLPCSGIELVLHLVITREQIGVGRAVFRVVDVLRRGGEVPWGGGPE